MVSRRLKLKPNQMQTRMMEGQLWQYTGLYNWAVRKLYHDAAGGRFYSRFDLCALINGHSTKCGLNLHSMRLVLVRAMVAHQSRKVRCRPARLKSRRNRMSSIPLGSNIRWVERTHVQVPGFGLLKVRPGKDFPVGKIKSGVLERKARGWYLTLHVDAEPRPIDAVTDLVAGVDFGFSRLATLSSGEIIEHPKEHQRLQRRLGQADRGHNPRLLGAIHQRLANARRCRNHQISRDLLSRHRVLYLSRDNYRALMRGWGKSIQSAGLSQLIRMLHDKSRLGGREIIEVSNINSTRTCADCGALTGPAGLAGLKVRIWSCSACGAEHDRDVNAAMNALLAGAALAHESGGDPAPETREVPGSSEDGKEFVQC